MSADRPINRRNFFRHGLGELLRPHWCTSAGPLEEMLRQINSIDKELQTAEEAAAAVPPGTPLVRGTPDAWLRPPGALPEQHFRDTLQPLWRILRAGVSRRPVHQNRRRGPPWGGCSVHRDRCDALRHVRRAALHACLSERSPGADTAWRHRHGDGSLERKRLRSQRPDPHDLRR